MPSQADIRAGPPCQGHAAHATAIAAKAQPGPHGWCACGQGCVGLVGMWLSRDTFLARAGMSATDRA